MLANSNVAPEIGGNHYKFGGASGVIESLLFIIPCIPFFSRQISVSDDEKTKLAPRGCFFFLVRCVIVLLATVKTCQRKLVLNSFTPGNKAGYTRASFL